MRNIILIILFSAFSLHIHAQNWEWAKNGMCASFDAGYSTVVDNSQNSYVAGVFTDSIVFDNVKLYSKGEKDIFIAKYDVNGNFLWATSGGSKGEETVNEIIIDSRNNLYLIGAFGKEIINPYTSTDTAYFSTQSIGSKGGQDILLLKYDSDGILSFIKGYGSPYDDEGKSINFMNNSSKIVFTGVFSDYNGSPPVYGDIFFDTIHLTSNGDADVFIAECDTIGVISFAKTYGSPLLESVSNIRSDSLENIYVLGYFTDHIWLDTINLQSISGGFTIGNIFLMKLDVNNKVNWAQAIGVVNSGNNSAGALVPIDIDVNKYGNVFLTGSYFHSALKFENGQTLNYSDQFSAFVMRCDNNGHIKWVKKTDGMDNNSSAAIAIDTDQNCYLTGEFFGQVVFGNFTLQSNGYEDVFLCKYDSMGNEVCAISFGEESHDHAYGITVNSKDGSLCLTGSFESNILNLGSVFLNNMGNADFFLLKGTSNITNIEGIPLPLSCQLYPNPNNGNFTIDLQSKKYQHLSITDLTGKTVYTQELGNSNNVIITTMLPNGMYFIKLQSKSGQVVEKMMIEK